MSFVVAKLAWMVLQPSNLLALLLAVTVLFRRFRLAMALVLLATAVVVLPVGRWLIQPLEARFARPADLPGEVAGIIVLGGAQEPEITASHGVLALDRHAERLIEGQALALRYPDARLVFSGGSGRLGGGDNEQLVNRIFVELMEGDPERILFEDRSRNTFENAVYTKERVMPQAGETWLLVTSAAHMPRSIGIFDKLDWPVVPWPVDYQSPQGLAWPDRLDVSERLLELDQATREWLGLLAYYLMDRTSALFPAP